MRTRVKICCISSIEEAKLAIKNGVDAIGLVGNMPSGPGVIDDNLIAKIAKFAPPPIATFLLTCETEPDKIISHHKKVNTTTIQLVDEVKPEAYSQIRSNLPAVKIVQVIHVIDEDSVEQAISISQFVDAILLDSGNPNLKVKELGGTGKVHNWKLSRKIVESVSIPVFLAGGLNPDNIVEAVEAVHPFGVDVCSGLRTNGLLDESKVEKFMNAIHVASRNGS
ncbi:MAG: phosphoribosylanthranilate isomerase [Melioribacteraceae bacterium]|jgi:phosphoribosylanthranilate isomerase|nr:phosphoribosylanthranilate isomerase [Melioribacteraceae bacterium]RJP73331.1 MAG: phosphoribosylanthranilate isomerase [Ignavibacteriales bacterium]